MKVRLPLWPGVSVAVLLLAAACAGREALPGIPGAPLGASSSASLRIVIHVAKRTSTMRRGRPRWVSPSSQSISLSFAPSSGSGAPTAFDINLGSNCTTTSTTKTCTESLTMKPGSYLASISTYDQPNEGGNMLSHGENLTADIVAGKANKLSLTLGGVPHTISVTGATSSVRGSAGTGLTIYNGAAQMLIITAQDADGNTIVGAGTPWTGSVSSGGSSWSIEATPSPAHANALAVTPPNSTGSTATLKIAAKYDAATCAQTGVVCSVSFGVTNDVQILAISNCLTTCGNGPGHDGVFIYEAPYTGYPTTTVTSGVFDPLAVAIAPGGTMFVANCGANCGYTGGDSVTVYKPPYSGAPSTTITNGVSYPAFVATDNAGDLVVDNCQTCLGVNNDNVTVYPHGSLTGTPITLSNVDGQVDGFAFDPSQNLLVAVCNAGCGFGPEVDAVMEYAPPYSGTPTPITNGIGFGSNTAFMAFDSSGDLFVPNCLNCSGVYTFSITKYAPPYAAASNPTQTITNQINTPLALGLDASNNLYVANGPGGNLNDVASYVPAAYSVGTQLFSESYFGSNIQAYQLVLDVSGDLIMTDGASVYISPAPYTELNDVMDLGGTSSYPFSLAP